MKIKIVLLSILFLLSCNNENKKKELELKERELELKNKELDIEKAKLTKIQNIKIPSDSLNSSTEKKKLS